MHAHATFTPGAGYDQGFDKVALDAIKIRGLVMFVQQSKRHQEQARLDAPPFGELMVDVELLDLELACVIG